MNMEQQSVVNPSHKGMKCRVKSSGGVNKGLCEVKLSVSPVLVKLVAKGFVEHKARGHKVVFSLYHNKGPCQAKAKCEPEFRILVKLIG